MPLSKHLAILCYLVSAPIWAGNTIHICAEDDWAPYSSSQNGHSVGAAVDLIRAIYAKQHINVQFDSLSYNRCLKLTSKGQYDAVLNVAKTADRVPLFAWPSQAMMKINLKLIANKQRPRQTPNFGVFTKSLVGITTGYEYPEQILSNPDIIKIESQSELSNLRRLAHGNLDFMVLSESTLSSLSPQLSSTERSELSNWGTLTQLDLYLAFNPKASQLPLWIHAYEAGLNEIHKKGEDKAIFAHWKAEH